MNVYDFSVKDMQGEQVSLDIYRGKVLLLVNTASKCGYTPQFEQLEAMYERYVEADFEIIGFPCNQFAHEDPGTNEEILTFCQTQYGVKFPMMAKIDVNGPEADALFVYLRKTTRGVMGDRIKWNFTKFLVNKEGKVIKRYAPSTSPDEIAKDVAILLK
ncbi:MAG: glutathione peroxidase [Erysipelotrichaceae bacterium]